MRLKSELLKYEVIFDKALVENTIHFQNYKFS